jgi:serine/threonine protein phosphatase PrpC
MLLVFTDGLTDSISGETPEDRLRGAMTADPGSSLSNLKALADPKLNQDDVTILLVRGHDLA